MSKNPSVRLVNFLCGIAVVILLIAAVYVQQLKGLEPCPLCMVQRFAFIGLAVLFFIGIILPTSKKAVRVIHNLFLIVVSGLGLVAASRQVWLMHFAPEKAHSCGADFFYMVQHLPTNVLIEQILQSPGDCAKESWQLLGISLPMWSLLALAFFLLISIWQILRKV